MFKVLSEIKDSTVLMVISSHIEYLSLCQTTNTNRMILSYIAKYKLTFFCQLNTQMANRNHVGKNKISGYKLQHDKIQIFQSVL